MFNAHAFRLESRLTRCKTIFQVTAGTQAAGGITLTECHVERARIQTYITLDFAVKRFSNKSRDTSNSKKSKRQHVTLLLKQLHWLPNQTRIDYKLATLAFRHFDGSLPQYLSSRLDIYQPSRSLRSSNDRLLRVPRWKLKSFGYRSFSYQGPVVWNSLPTDLKLLSSLYSFKSRLKTHLFKKSYSLC